MSDALLPYYNRELSFLRRQAARSPRRTPRSRAGSAWARSPAKIPTSNACIEAFAYLHARIRHKLDDEFPEMTESLLGVLYPHYRRRCRRWRSCSLKLDPGQNELTTGYTVPRHSPPGDRADPGRAVPLPHLLPGDALADRGGSRDAGPAAVPGAAHCTSAAAASVLRCDSPACSEAMTFAELGPASLRFFLKGQPQHV